MFSFGGFSSILPYIGYLSLMWVCILIGASGQVNKIFEIISHPKHTVETTIEEKNSLQTVFFEKIIKSKPVPSKEIFAAFLFHRYPDFNPVPKQFFETSYVLRPECYIRFNGLRAPPGII